MIPLQILLAVGYAQAKPAADKPPPGYGAPPSYGAPQPQCTTVRVKQPTSYNCKQDQECSTTYEQQCEERINLYTFSQISYLFRLS